MIARVTSCRARSGSGMPRKTPTRAKHLSRSPPPRHAAAERVPSRTPQKALSGRKQSPGPLRRRQGKEDGTRGRTVAAALERMGTRVSADRFARSKSPIDPAVLRREREAEAVVKLREFAQVAAQQEIQARDFERGAARSSRKADDPIRQSEPTLQEHEHAMLSLKLQDWALRQVLLMPFFLSLVVLRAHPQLH